jgi:hypothetical protein
MNINKLLEKLPDSALGLDSSLNSSVILKKKIMSLLHNFSKVATIESKEIELIVKALNKLELESIPSTSLKKELCNLKEAIEKKGRIEMYPCAAYISTQPTNSVSRYEIIQTRMLIAATCLSNLVNYQVVISKAFQQFRTMIDKNENIIEFLPDFTIPLNKLIDELDSLRKKQPKFMLRIMPIKKLFTCYQVKAPVYIPIIRQPSITLSPGGPIISTNIDSGDESVEITEYQQILLDETDYLIEGVERAIDQTKSEQYFSVNHKKSQRLNKSLTLQNQASKAVINNIARRQKKLSTSTSNLTKKEVAILINQKIKITSKRGDEVNIGELEEYPYILLSLIYGQDVRNLYSEKFDLNNTFDSQNNCYRYIVSTHIELPKHEVNSDYSSWINRSGKIIDFTLPDQIYPVLPDVSLLYLKAAPHNLNIDYILTDINKRYKTKITVDRIKNYFEYYMIRKGIDGAEIAFIINKGLLQEPGTYYYSVNIYKLQKINQCYIEDIFKEPNNEYKFDKNKIGSQLQVNPSTVKNLFDEISIRLNNERNRRSEGVVAFHNMFVLHSILLLNLATGYRAVCEPFESVNIFDFNANTIFISDKEERTELAARVLVVPELAMEQLTKYLAHLNILSIYYRNTHPIISNQILLSKDGDSAELPLFFFIFDNEIVPVTPTTLAGYLDPVFPLKLNWHRHFMRTKLRELGFSGQIVDSWMGHIGNTGASFDRYSGLSMGDLRKVSEGIHNYMKEELNIKTINGMSIN